MRSRVGAARARAACHIWEQLGARMRAGFLHCIVRSVHLDATYTEKRRMVSVSSVAMVMAVQPQQYLCHSIQEIQPREMQIHEIQLSIIGDGILVYRH